MDFYKRAELACRLIPPGKTATYGQLALLCQKPGNARQIGYGLRTGKIGDVPAHRVVNAAGILSGAAFFETFDMQKCLLEKEGVEVKRTEAGWKVELREWGWRNTLEDALWLEAEFERMGI